MQVAEGPHLQFGKFANVDQARIGYGLDGVGARTDHLKATNALTCAQQATTIPKRSCYWLSGVGGVGMRMLPPTAAASYLGLP